MKPQYAKKSILVVSGTDKLEQSLSALLPCAEFTLYTAGSCAQARSALLNSAYDIIVINAPLSDDYGIELALDLVQRSVSGIILLAQSALFPDVCDKLEPYGVMTLEKPTPRVIMYAALRMSAAVSARLRRAEEKQRALSEKMEEIRIVNRAKWALIKYLKMDETQAHRHIEKMAMDRRISKREMAEKIISNYEE